MILKPLLMVTLFAISALTLAVQPAHTAQADVEVTVHECTSDDIDSLPVLDFSEVRGTLYFRDRGQDAYSTSLKKFTSIEDESFDLPFWSRDSRRRPTPWLSPTGRLVAFHGYSINVPLTVWDRLTGETAEIQLTQAEWDNFLIRKFEHAERQKLIWKDTETLALQFLDTTNEYDEYSAYVIAQQEFLVTTSPLTISRSEYRSVDLPNVPGFDRAERDRMLLSPKVTYTVFQDYEYEPGSLNGRIQLFRSADLSLELDTSTFIRPTQSAFSDNIWSEDERVFFFSTQEILELEGLTEIYDRFYQSEAETGFTPDDALSQRLDEIFSDGFRLLSVFETLLSPDNRTLAFYLRGNHKEYFILYNWQSRTAVLVCNPVNFSYAGAMVPFWSPDSRYIVYYDSSGRLTFVVDTRTATLYQLPTDGLEFITWLEGYRQRNTQGQQRPMQEQYIP